MSFIGSSSILQLSINVADGDEVGRGEIGGNKTNLLNPSVSKKSTGAGYLTSKGAKKTIATLKEVATISKKVSKPLNTLIT